MTEITETTTATVTDSKGRVLEVRLLNALEQLDLFEAAGGNSSNPPWLGMAMIAYSVRSIDGVPCPLPTNRAQVRAAIGKLGTEGISAVQTALSPADAETVAQAVIEQAGN